MDPLSALSIASAVVQFLGVGIKVAKRLSEYNNASPSDVPKSLQSINTQLPLVLNALSKVKTDAAVDRIDVDTRCILRGVVVGCTRIIEEVEELINKIAHVPGESLAVKLRKVLSSMRNDEEIWAIDKKLQTYISVLILHHVIDSSDAPTPAPEETFYYDVREKHADPFYQRDNLMQKLDKHFYEAARSQIKSPTTVLLVGGEGNGKTQLALEYCRQAYALGQFRTVFWVDAATPEKLCLGLESIAATVRRSVEGSRNEKIEFVKSFLGERWHPWLLVLHNYNDAAFQRVTDYLPYQGSGAIIFTTSRKPATSLGKIVQVPKYLTTAEQEELNRRLSNAANAKDFEGVKTSIESGANVNCVDRNGWPPLDRSAIHGHEEAVRFLLDQGANPHADAARNPPIYWAASGGSVNIVQMLLDDEDSRYYKSKPEDDNNVFIVAVEKGHTEIVRLMISRRKINVNAKDGYKRTAFHHATSGGHSELVKLLLGYGADPDGSERGAALRKAAKEGHIATVEALCTSGNADPNSTDENGYTALYYALGDNADRKDLFELLLKLGADPTIDGENGGVLLNASTHQSTEIVQKLLDLGANPTTSDQMKYTPLLNAIKYSNTEMTDLLSKAEIKDATARSEYLEGALKFAARNGKRDAVLSILRAPGGVNLDSVDWSGATPLVLAIKGGHIPTARLLLKQGARLDIPDKDGNLPLLLAASSGNDALVKNILSVSKTPDMKDAKEDTALCVAAAAGHARVVKQLMDFGADVDLANKYGDTPLDIAEEKNHKKVIDLLNGLTVDDLK